MSIKQNFQSALIFPLHFKLEIISNINHITIENYQNSNLNNYIQFKS